MFWCHLASVGSVLKRNVSHFSSFSCNFYLPIFYSTYKFRLQLLLICCLYLCSTFKIYGICNILSLRALLVDKLSAFNAETTRLGPYTIEPTRLCSDTIVPRHDCAHTRLCPHTIVPTHDCALTCLCQDTIVPIHDCVHTRLCPHTFVPTHVCAHTSLCPHMFVPKSCGHNHVWAETCTFVSRYVIIKYRNIPVGILLVIA